MKKSILIAYASKYGSTKEIAEKIGDQLQQNGVEVDVFPVEVVKNLTCYQAVILGSAVYVGKWAKEAVSFIKTNEASLADRPVWIFSSGPTGEGNPIDLVDGKRVPAALQATIDHIQPREVTVFHGNINLEKVNPIEKWAVKSVVKKPFGDFRDWNSIADWATKIGQALKEPVNA